jgi:aarF domain-containing kinase
VRDIIEAEFGRDLESTFSSFEPTPIGAASIGQVHRAVLRATNEPVVVKICYPHVERLLKGDVRTVKLFAKLAQPVYVPALEEVEVQFATEFDYRKEGQQLGEIGDNLRQAKLAGPGPYSKFIVPKPYLPYCTKHVLVMEELKGQKLVTGLRQDLERQAARLGQTVDQLLQRRHTTIDTLQRETTNPEAAKHDGNSVQGPSAQQYQRFIGLAESQRRLQNLYVTMYNIAWGYLVGSPMPYHDKSELPLNHAQMIDDLFVAHGHTVLVNGVFNGDPHVRSPNGNSCSLRVAASRPHYLPSCFTFSLVTFYYVVNRMEPHNSD